MSGHNNNATSYSLKKALRFFPFFIFSQLIFLTSAFGFDRPFNNAANWGGTGLIEIPSARILEDGVVRFGYAQANPYRWYVGGMGVFPGLEFSSRFTEIMNIPTSLIGYGAYKDKAFDLKYQILPESKLLPAVAIGLHDFHGTQLFEAQYLVLTRQIFPFDFTIGLGRKRLKGVFGAIEWALHKRFHILVEYNPIEYEKDKGALRNAVPEGAELPINVGVRIKPLPGVSLGISCQRGDTFGFMVHVSAKLGEPILPKRPDPPLWHTVDRRPLRERDAKEMVEKIHKAIHEAGFRDVTIYTDGTELTAEFENSKYLSNQKAVGRVLRILLFHSPADTRRIGVILKRRRMPFLRVTLKPQHLEKYLLGKIPQDVFNKLIEVESAEAGADSNRKNLVKAEGDKKLDYRLGIKPSIQTYLNDPSGVFKCRVGIKPYVITAPWKGASVFARYDVPFYSNISSSHTPLPDAVKSDSWLYLGRDYSFDRLILDQAIQLSEKTFGRLSCGYFDRMYAGTGGEILTFFDEHNMALGVEADLVRKREPETQLDLLDFKSHTVLGNFYYRIPKVDVTLHAQYGRFLAGDRGWMFDLSREYSTGAILGFWYSFTDTDDLTAFNKGYHHKGIFLNVPARMFQDYESNIRYRYTISPWTRDVAATVSHWQDLFHLGSDLMPAEFTRDLRKIRE